MEETCPVCYDNFKINELKKYKCEHFICSACDYKLQIFSNKCPTCRSNIKPPQEALETTCTIMEKSLADIKGMMQKIKSIIDEDKTVKTEILKIQELFKTIVEYAKAFNMYSGGSDIYTREQTFTIDEDSLEDAFSAIAASLTFPLALLGQQQNNPLFGSLLGPFPNENFNYIRPPSNTPEQTQDEHQEEDDDDEDENDESYDLT